EQAPNILTGADGFLLHSHVAEQVYVKVEVYPAFGQPRHVIMAADHRPAVLVVLPVIAQSLTDGGFEDRARLLRRDNRLFFGHGRSCWYNHSADRIIFVRGL